jgi:hypothetical protein
MSIIIVVVLIPLAYLILVAASMLPRDEGLFALVILNSIAWSIHYKLKDQVKQEISKRTISAGNAKFTRS